MPTAIDPDGDREQAHPASGGRSLAASAAASRSTTDKGLDLQVILAALRSVVQAALTAFQIGRRDHDSRSRLLDQVSAELLWLGADSSRWNRRRATANSCADWKRVRRFLLKARSAMRSSSAGTSTHLASDGGASNLIARQIASGWVPRTGALPASIS